MDVSRYMPHGMCLLWEPWLVGLWVSADALIAISYFAIPFALVSVVRGRPDLRYRGLLSLFAAFILLCGIVHVLSIVTLWIPVYPPMGAVKLATGLVSATTAVVLFRLVPVFRKIPSPAQLEAANADLREAIAAHEATLADLRAMRDELELRVAARTEALARANEATTVAMREAVHRSSNLLAVVNGLARQSARGATDIRTFVEEFTGRIDALARATASVIRDPSENGAELEAVIRNQLEPLLLTFGPRVEIAGDSYRVGTRAAQQIALALHELATNAQKYGALSGEEGRVRVEWHAGPAAGEDGAFVLTWRETLADAVRGEGEGGGTGFGSHLLTRIVPAALDGEATRELTDGGLTYALRAPRASLAPRKRDAVAAASVPSLAARSPA